MTMIEIASTDLMNSEQTAAMLGLKVQTLAAWRASGRHGLRFIRCGRSIRYRRQDVLDFITQNSATSCAALDAATTAIRALPAPPAKAKA